MKNSSAGWVKPPPKKRQVTQAFDELPRDQRDRVAELPAVVGRLEERAEALRAAGGALVDPPPRAREGEHPLHEADQAFQRQRVAGAKKAAGLVGV